jgi:predicted nuclease of predicted toxin-antitoxin system
MNPLLYLLTERMNLYVDDDMAARRLVALLSSAGHGVVVPTNVDLSGVSDAQHLIHAMRQSLVLMTRNHDDFLDLHEVVQVAHGTHPGILIVRFENDPTRDLTSRQIVTAISRLESAAVPLENQVYILNHWR